MKTVILLSLLASFSALSAAGVNSSYIERQATAAFIDEMISKHRFGRDELEYWFSSASKKQVIIDAISRPAEKTKTWAEYRKIFVTPSRINQGVLFWQENLMTLQKAETEFGVPPEIIVAIIGVETFYGKRQGRFRVIDAPKSSAGSLTAIRCGSKMMLEPLKSLSRNSRISHSSSRASRLAPTAATSTLIVTWPPLVSNRK